MARGLVKQESVESEMHKSEDQSKTFVYTKKRGYDVTRNPHLNKVTTPNLLCSFRLFKNGFYALCSGSAPTRLSMSMM